MVRVRTQGERTESEWCSWWRGSTWHSCQHLDPVQKLLHRARCESRNGLCWKLAGSCDPHVALMVGISSSPAVLLKGLGSSWKKPH